MNNENLLMGDIEDLSGGEERFRIKEKSKTVFTEKKTIDEEIEEQYKYLLEEEDNNINVGETEYLKASCLRKVSNFVFCLPKRKKEKQSTSNRKSIALLRIFISFLVQLSLLIVDDVDYGFWGFIFENLKFLSLNVNFNIESITSELGYLIGIYMMPYLLMIWFLLALNGLHDSNLIKFTKIEYLVKTLAFLLLILSIVFIFRFGYTSSLFVIVPTFILYLSIFLHFIRNKIVKILLSDSSKNGHKKRINFHKSEGDAAEICLLLLLPSLISTWMNTAVLNDNIIIAIIGGFVGGFIIFHLFLRKFIELRSDLLDYFDIKSKMSIHEEDKYIDFLVNFTHFLFQQVVGPEEIRSIVLRTKKKNEKGFFTTGNSYFPLVFIIERVLIASIPNIAAAFDTNGQIIRAANYLVFSIILLIFLRMLIWRVYVDDLFRKADQLSRFSNIIIFGFAICISEFEGQTFSKTFELYASILMFFVSLYMLFFWLSLYDILFNWILKSGYSQITYLTIELEMQRLNTIEKIQSFVLKKKNETVTTNEWKAMNHFQRLCVMCTERTKNINIIENENQLEVICEPELNCSELDDDNWDTYRSKGIINMCFKKLIFGRYHDNSISDFKMFSETQTLKKLNEKGTVAFEIKNRKLTPEQINYIFESLISLNSVEEIGFKRTSLKESSLLISKQLSCFKSLKILYFNYCRLEDDEAKLIATSSLSLKTLKQLSFQGNLLTDSFVEYICIEILNKDSQLEQLLINKNKNTTLTSLSVLVDCALNNKKLRTIGFQPFDTSGVNTELYYELRNECFLRTFEYPELNFYSTSITVGVDDTIDGCFVYLKQSNNNYEFLSEENFGKATYEALEDGLCSILPLALSLLTKKWLKIALKHITNNKRDPKTKLTIVELIILNGKGIKYKKQTLEYLNTLGFAINIEKYSKQVKEKYTEIYEENDLKL